MKLFRTFLVAGWIATSFAGASLAQQLSVGTNDNVKLGVCAGPVTSDGVSRSGGISDRLFPPRTNANSEATGSSPSISRSEGGGTPSSRGGVGDTLLGTPQADGKFFAPRAGAAPGK